MTPKRRAGRRIDPHSEAEVGRRLRRLREVFGFTQEQMARRAGVTTPAWNNYERGHNSPRWQTGARIARVLGVTTDWIYRGDVGGLPVRTWRRLTAGDDSPA